MSAALIVSIIVVLAIVFSGFRNGLFSSAATLLMFTVSIAIAVTFYEPLAASRPFQGMEGYAQPVTLAGLFVVVYFLFQITANVFAPPTVHMQPKVNRIGGVAVSLVTAVLLSGFLGLLLCMTPWTGARVDKLEGESFIGVHPFADSIERMTRWSLGHPFDAQGTFKRLKDDESDRVCHRNLERILLRLNDIYANWDAFEPMTESKQHDAIVLGKNLVSDGASGGKGVGENGIICPCSGKPYAIRLLQFRDMPTREKERLIHAYDAEACHNGRRMVLWTWRGYDGTRSRVTVQGRIESMTDAEFPADLKSTR